MKLAVKTLKGEKFEVIVEGNHTVSQVKGIIVRLYPVIYRKCNSFGQSVDL
jgi:hypothetical protein